MICHLFPFILWELMERVMSKKFRIKGCVIQNKHPDDAKDLLEYTCQCPSKLWIVLIPLLGGEPHHKLISQSPRKIWGFHQPGWLRIQFFPKKSQQQEAIPEWQNIEEKALMHSYEF